jgi:hypothetical protein
MNSHPFNPANYKLDMNADSSFAAALRRVYRSGSADLRKWP